VAPAKKVALGEQLGGAKVILPPDRSGAQGKFGHALAVGDTLA